MRFSQLDYEFRQCEQHLDATGTRNTEIETYLVRYLLVRICAEYETRIEILVQKRCASRVNDQHVFNFAFWGTEISTKRYKIENLSETLKRFGADYQKTFVDAVLNKACAAAWNNICTNRHSVAHENGAVMMTLSELKTAYQDSLIVIDELVKALCLRSKDIKGLK
ncbi:MAG: HEPN domain-containing protein [Acidobacteriota bacterium]|nr:HEPN domain-containing protein [Acidobacteriota bacterium]